MGSNVAGRDQNLFSRQKPAIGEKVLHPFDNLLRFRHAPFADVTASQLSFARLNEQNAPFFSESRCFLALPGFHTY